MFCLICGWLCVSSLLCLLCVKTVSRLLVILVILDRSHSYQNDHWLSRSIYRIFVLQNKEWSKNERKIFFDKNCNVFRRIIGVDTREIRATIFPVKVQIWSLWCCAVWNQYYRNRIILAGVKIHDKYRLFYFFSSVDLCFCCYVIHARQFWFDIYVSCVKTALILVGYTEWIGGVWTRIKQNNASIYLKTYK